MPKPFEPASDWARRSRASDERAGPVVARTEPSRSSEEFEAWCTAVYGFRDLVVVVEEAAAVCQASYLSPAFGRIVRQGRHRGLGLLWTSQRLNEVSRTLTGLTDVWAGFSTSEPNDLAALAQRAGRNYAERVSKLSRFEFLGYDVDGQVPFEDKARLKALWGAPPEWQLPAPQGSVASRKVLPLRVGATVESQR